MRHAGMPQTSLPISNVLVHFTGISSDSLCYSKMDQDGISSELNIAGPMSAGMADRFHAE